MTFPDNYYNRFDPEKQYDSHLFLAGNVLQSAELNELQSSAEYQRLLDNNGLFVDGQLVSGGQVFLNLSTSLAVCNNTVVYLLGKNRAVAEASLGISLITSFYIGIWLISTYVTDEEDITLLDPAIGELGYGEAGAARLKIEAIWGLSTDSVEDSLFFPLYSVTNGVLSPRQKLSAPNRSPYPDQIIVGMAVVALPELNENEQRYIVRSGSALVAGESVIFEHDHTSSHDVEADVGLTSGEIHVSTNVVSQRINTNNSPISSVVSVTITKQTTSTLTRGNVFNTADLLPHTNVVSIVSIAGYTQGVDYALDGDYVDWSLGGIEPAAAATYDVVYRYVTEGTASAIDTTGFTIAEAVVGTDVIVDYYSKTPRIDALCLSRSGVVSLVTGVSSGGEKVPPSIPSGCILLALIFQFWNASTFVQQSETRQLSVADAGHLPSRLRDIESRLLMAEQVADIGQRNAASRYSYFSDSFADGSLRDFSLMQDAAVVSGVLTLPVSNVLILQPTSDVSSPTCCDFTATDDVSQIVVNGSLKINQHNESFGKQQPVALLNPPVNRWAEMAGSQDFTTGLFLGSELKNQENGVSYPLEVKFSISGFLAGEVISSVIIDGVDVAVSAL